MTFLFRLIQFCLWLSDPEQGRDPAVGARVGGCPRARQRKPRYKSGSAICELLPISYPPLEVLISPPKSEGNVICPLTPQAHWGDQTRSEAESEAWISFKEKWTLYVGVGACTRVYIWHTCVSVHVYQYLHKHVCNLKMYIDLGSRKEEDVWKW